MLDFCRLRSVIFLTLRVKFVNIFHKNTEYLNTHYVYNISLSGWIILEILYAGRFTVDVSYWLILDVDIRFTRP